MPSHIGMFSWHFPFPSLDLSYFSQGIRLVINVYLGSSQASLPHEAIIVRLHQSPPYTPRDTISRLSSAPPHAPISEARHFEHFTFWARQQFYCEHSKVSIGLPFRRLILKKGLFRRILSVHSKMADFANRSGFADNDSSSSLPKSNTATRKIISSSVPTKDRAMSNSCTSAERSTNSSTVSMPNAPLNELVRKRKLVEDSSYIRQAPEQTPCEGHVCLQCLQLDLQKVTELYRDTTSREKFSRGFLIGNVGNRYRQPLDTDCPLCLMLCASRVTDELPATSSHSNAAEVNDELRAYSFLDHSNLHNRQSSGAAEVKIRMAHDSLHLVVVPQDCPTDYELTVRCQREGYAVFFQDENQANMFAAQVVPSNFHPGQVRIWLDYCKRYHKTLCRPSNSQLRGLKLIDCEALAIQDATDEIHYVALSYVWGSASYYHYQVQDSSGRSLLPRSLAPVISDAISVTKALGFRYLWIDKFCIDQNDADTKHYQIQQMDAIYENSELTIIAAAGGDENHGLPGVGARSRTFQPTARVGEVKVVWTMRDPHYSIRSSKWFTRGWTFQEAVLSRRRLVFTEEQIYFECNAMNCFESIHTPLESLHIKNKSKIRDSIRAGVFGRNEREVYGKVECR